MIQMREMFENEHKSIQLDERWQSGGKGKFFFGPGAHIFKIGSD